MQRITRLFENMFKHKGVATRFDAPDGNEPLVAIDVGCRWGFAERFMVNLDEVRLYGFEPDSIECERLKSRYNHQNVNIIPLGLAKKNGRYTLYRTREPACSSMYKPSGPVVERYPSLSCASLVDTTEFDAVTLDEWADNNGIRYVDYIKLDTQGSELDILQGGVRALKTTRIIDLEVEFNPIYENQPLFSDVDVFLRSQGFMLWKFNTLVHYGTTAQKEIELGDLRVAYDDHDENVKSRGGQLFWADACYVRNDMLNAVENITPLKQKVRDVRLAKILQAKDLLAVLENEIGRQKP